MSSARPISAGYIRCGVLLGAALPELFTVATKLMTLNAEHFRTIAFPIALFSALWLMVWELVRISQLDFFILTNSSGYAQPSIIIAISISSFFSKLCVLIYAMYRLKTTSKSKLFVGLMSLASIIAVLLVLVNDLIYGVLTANYVSAGSLFGLSDLLITLYDLAGTVYGILLPIILIVFCISTLISMGIFQELSSKSIFNRLEASNSGHRFLAATILQVAVLALHIDQVIWGITHVNVTGRGYLDLLAYVVLLNALLEVSFIVSKKSVSAKESIKKRPQATSTLSRTGTQQAGNTSTL